MNSEVFQQKVEAWINYSLNVIVKGSLVICEDAIYSYQMKIGYRDRSPSLEDGYSNDIFFLVSPQDCPSNTTKKHLGLVRNILNFNNERVKEVSSQNLATL